jgi:hypothetical protein
MPHVFYVFDASIAWMDDCVNVNLKHLMKLYVFVFNEATARSLRVALLVLVGT